MEMLSSWCDAIGTNCLPDAVAAVCGGGLAVDDNAHGLCAPNCATIHDS